MNQDYTIPLKIKDFDPSDLNQAMVKSYQWGDKIPKGVIYKNTTKPVFDKEIPQLQKYSYGIKGT